MNTTTTDVPALTDRVAVAIAEHADHPLADLLADVMARVDGLYRWMTFDEHTGRARRFWPSGADVADAVGHMLDFMGYDLNPPQPPTPRRCDVCDEPTGDAGADLCASCAADEEAERRDDVA